MLDATNTNFFPMHPTRALLAGLSLVSFGALAVSCGEKDVFAPEPQVRAITVFPNPATVRVDETLVMVVTMDADSAADHSLIWTSADPRRVAVSDNGILTGMSVGSGVVTVKSALNPSAIAIVPVTVMPAYTGVRSVTASPPSMSLLPGQSQAIAATVDADSKVSRDVRFEIDRSSVATVTAQGVVTGVAPGTARVTVRSVADPSVTAAVAVTVRPPSPTRVSIQALTSGGTSNPVNLENVRGQVDAVVNVEPGEAPLERVNLVVTNNGRDTVVASQNYAAAAAAERREVLRRAQSAADSALAEHTVAPIILSFRTNAFDTATGAVAFRNGPTSVKVVAISTLTSGDKQQEASSSLVAMLNNYDGFLVSVRGMSKTGILSALDANGRRWIQAGRGLLVTSKPVAFSGHAVGGRTISFPASSPVASVSSTKPGESVDTLLLPPEFVSTTTGEGYLSGELPSMIAADSLGNAMSLVPSINTVANGPGAGILNAQPTYLTGTRLEGIRIDDSAPPAASFSIGMTGNNVENWVNGSYKFSSGFTGLVPDPGVGLLVNNVNPTPETAAVMFFAFGNGLDTTDVQTASQLLGSNSNTDYKAIARYNDRLGNTRTVELKGNAKHSLASFGVDLTPPKLRYTTGSLIGRTLISDGADSAFADAKGILGPRAFSIQANDDGTQSGLLEKGISVSLARVSQPILPGGAGTSTCLMGTPTICDPLLQSTGYEGEVDGYLQFTVALDTTNTPDGYYTFTATVQDKAGNVATRVKHALFDAGKGTSAPVLSGLFPSTMLVGGQSAQFLVTATDNVELASGGVLIRYPNLPGTTQMFGYKMPQSGTAIGTAFDATLTSPLTGTHVAFTIPNFIRGLESVGANDAPQSYPANAKPDAINGWVRDFSPVGDFGSLDANRALDPALVQSPTSTTPGFKAAAGTPNELTFWRRAGTTGMAFQAVGITGQGVLQFTRVLLARREEPTGLTLNPSVWHVISELTTPVGADNGVTRTWTYDFGAQSSGDYIAIGVSPSGDAIVTRVVTP
jgi:hypothetical protein